MFGRVGSLGFLLVILFGLAHPADARQTTPAATPGTEICDVAPRSAEELTSLLSPPPANERVLEPPRVPPSSPADAATTEAITAVVRELEACFNSGDLLRVYALFSDDQFRQWTKTDESVADLASLEVATPAAILAGQRQVLTGPWHVELLNDGRVWAAVLFRFEDGVDYPSSTKALIFAHQDGRWLIQEMVDFLWLEGGVGPVPVEDIVGPPPSA